MGASTRFATSPSSSPAALSGTRPPSWAAAACAPAQMEARRAGRSVTMPPAASTLAWSAASPTAALPSRRSSRVVGAAATPSAWNAIGAFPCSATSQRSGRENDASPSHRMVRGNTSAATSAGSSRPRASAAGAPTSETRAQAYSAPLSSGPTSRSAAWQPALRANPSAALVQAPAASRAALAGGPFTRSARSACRRGVGGKAGGPHGGPHPGGPSAAGAAGVPARAKTQARQPACRGASASTSATSLRGVAPNRISPCCSRSLVSSAGRDSVSCASAESTSAAGSSSVPISSTNAAGAVGSAAAGATACGGGGGDAVASAAVAELSKGKPSSSRRASQSLDTSRACGRRGASEQGSGLASGLCQRTLPADSASGLCRAAQHAKRRCGAGGPVAPACACGRTAPLAR